jgi:beta-galactosidase
MIQIKDKKFIIHQKPTFLYGGELHYFRVPKSEWKDRLNKMKEAGLNMVSTYIPWQIHEKTEGDIDLNGRLWPENDLASFMALVKDSGMLCLVRPGPYIMSELTTDGIPLWLIENYPEALAQTQGGSSHHTRIFSYMHPIYLDRVKKWYKAVFEILTPYQIKQGGPIIMMQLDNEVGMFQWIVNQGDYSQLTLSYFIDYIQQKYVTIAAANAQLHTEMTQWEDLLPLIKKLDHAYALSLHHEYGLFNRQFFKRYLAVLNDMALDFGMDVPIVVNVHGFDQHDYAKRGLRYPIGLSQLKDTMEISGSILAGDYYIGNLVMDNFTDIIMADALTASLQNPNQPLFSAEFQGGFQTDHPILQPTSIDLNSRLCIADGMNGINYYMFVGGFNWHDSGLFGKIHDWQAPIDMNGKLRPSYHAIKNLGLSIRALGEDFLNSKIHVDVTIGWDPDIYMTEYWVSATKGMQDKLSQVRETGLFGLGRQLSLNNITYDALDLTSQPLDPKRTKTLIIVACPWMNPSLQQKLADYVQQGGNLILVNEVPAFDFYGKPCNILSHALGLKLKSVQHWGFASYDRWDSINFIAMHVYDHQEGFFESTLTKETAAFIKPIGKGQVLMIGILMDHERLFKADLWASLLSKLDVVSKFDTDDRVYLSERRSEKSVYLSALNLDEIRKTLTITRLGKLLFDGHPLILQSRQGVILPLDLELANGVILEYSTAELCENSGNHLRFTVTAKDSWIKFRNVTALSVSHPHELIKTEHTITVHLTQQDEQIVDITLGESQ